MNRPLLSIAVAENKLSSVEVLIKNNADVNAQGDVEGDTPLMWAVAKNNKEAVKMLMEEGVNPDIKTKKGETALEIARNKKYIEIYQLLSETPIKPRQY